MRRNIGKKPWFYPLPVLIIGTCDENGVPDAMNAAYGGLCTSNMIELRTLGCFLRFHRFKNLRENRSGGVNARRRLERVSFRLRRFFIGKPIRAKWLERTRRVWYTVGQWNGREARSGDERTQNRLLPSSRSV